MSIIINTKYRTDEIELMDDFSIKGVLLRDALDKLANINKWLGGNHVTLGGLKKILKDHPKQKIITIMDLGCGDGDMLRRVANYGKNEGYVFKLIGIDANEDAVSYARELSKNYSEISYLCQDIFSDEFKVLNYDLVLTTLFLHHFKEDEIVKVLKQIQEIATIGMVINDLHRHPMAYYLFKLLGLVIKNKMVKQDGLTSILRAFKKEDLVRISKNLNGKSYIQWKWAFRFQWILKTGD